MRTSGIPTFFLAVAVFAGGMQLAQGQSNSCGSATAIVAGTYSGNTAGFAPDGTTSCGLSNASPAVWYRYTPSANCRLDVDTCGSSYDTVVSIHTGCPGAPGNELACNDDACTNYSSRVSIGGVGGTTYYIRVSGWNGASGAYVLHLVCGNPTDNDDCSLAVPVQEGQSYSGDTLTATNDGSCSCGLSATAADRWYRYEALEDCRLFVDVCGADYDSVLSIHSGCPGTNANELVCNDDSCGLSSRVSFTATTGESYWIRVSGYNGARGHYTLNLNCSIPAPPGADAYVGELTDMPQFGRLGDVVGCATDSPLCNAGTQPLDWYANPDPRHPFMTFNAYRLRNDRFEQIGQSWVKHGWGAGQGDACGFGCTPNPNGTRLGVGCSDTYGASSNADQHVLGPRQEINPWTGAYDYATSYLSHLPPSFNPVEHRLTIHDADLANGGSFIAECYIACHDDMNHMNSLSHEAIALSGAPGGTWTFGLGAGASINGPAINAWPGATLTTIPAQVTTDGRCILAAKATQLGPNSWHYEYALYNHDMDRGVRSLRIPILGAAQVSNIGFHAVESSEAGFSNNAWAVTRDSSGIVWSTGSSGDVTANPLRWGTLYNFRFDADVAPGSATATLGLFKPGTPAQVAGATVGPHVIWPTGDMNCDGVLNNFDIEAFVLALTDAAGYAAAFPGCDINNGDVNHDGAVNNFDIDPFVACLTQGCP